MSLPFSPASGARGPFNLMRWFSITALVSVVAVSTLSALALSAFLTKRMIRQEAELTAGFVRSFLATENAYALFRTGEGERDPRLGTVFSRILSMPDVLRVNVYSPEHTVIWSSNPRLVGHRFDPNEELEEALRAQLVVNSGVVDREHQPKSEHMGFGTVAGSFVESYVPVFDAEGRRVIGVIELYKTPRGLFEAIRSGHRLLWAAAFGAGVFLYLTLFWIVRRAHRVIEQQREQLIEAEALAVVGEMSSAVAHGLRNPLASIRSSAELALGGELPADAREYAGDIVAQVDRLERWIRQLLTYAKPSHTPAEAVDINAVLLDTLEGYRHDLERQRTCLRLDLAQDLPPVRGGAALLGQLLGSLISNAGEALQEGGEITLRTRDEGPEQVRVEVADTGPGLSRENAEKVFKPFFTTKQKGLGLGLPIVRRSIERLGGRITFASEPGQGTVVQLHLPVHRDEGSPS